MQWESGDSLLGAASGDGIGRLAGWKCAVNFSSLKIQADDSYFSLYLVVYIKVYLSLQAYI